MPRPRAAPTYKQRDNGVYYAAEFSERQGRTIYTSLHTKDADEARKRFARYLVDGPEKTRPGRDALVTVGDVLDWYIRDHIEPKVVDKGRQYDAIAYLRSYFGDTPVVDVDVALSRAYTEARRMGAVRRARKRAARDGGAGSDSTVRRELHVLVAAVNSAIRFKKLPRECALQVELPAEQPSTAAWITKAQLSRALAAAEGPLRDFILLAYYTAARRRSIERLTKAQVDLKHGRINLQPPASVLTKKRKPIVPIYPEIRSTVERLGEGDGEFLFGDGNTSFYRPFVELMADLGVEAHPHMLRHSRATHMLMDGEDPYKVAKLLGDTLQTVERVYGHHSVDYLNTKSTIEEVA